MPAYTNHLASEKSPYLLQHAHNPVDWHPWCDEAFELARREDKPIFLSIGYATCHWCHVMEHESFENLEIAGLLNEAFVCIKVDREERPDIDEIYMNVCQMLTQSGGWPLTIVMTPEKKPFFAATYIPPENRMGRLGMVELIPRLSNAWKNRREEILASSEKITAVLSKVDTSSAAVDPSILARTFHAEAAQFDPVYGGFGNAPKFPMAHRLTFMIRQDPEAAQKMVTHTLSALRRGGIWDQVGHGIHRYSTDRKWLVPHFEKMLYDQALLALACIEAFEAYGDASARKIAEEIFEYVLRDMTAPGGGFYSAEDADSEGVEGKFYVWSMEALRDLFDAPQLDEVVKHFNIRPDGNFLDEATRVKTGENILYRKDLDADLESVRNRLFEIREKRIHPLKDTKVLADWNGLMIAAFAKAGRVFNEPKYTGAAQRAVEFIFSEMQDDGRLWHRWREGEVLVPGQLDDYAFITFGLLELYETTFEVQILEKAVALNEVVLNHFSDEEQGGFFLTADDAEELIVRPKSLYDGAIPSGNSVHMMNLIRLARLTGRMEYEALADRLLGAFAQSINQSGSGFLQALQAVQFTQGDAVEVVIVGDRDLPETQALIDAVYSVYQPHRTVILKTPGLEKLALFVKEMQPVEGQPTVYICRNFACEQPLVTPESVREALQR